MSRKETTVTAFRASGHIQAGQPVEVCAEDTVRSASPGSRDTAGVAVMDAGPGGFAYVTDPDGYAAGTWRAAYARLAELMAGRYAGEQR